MKKASSKALSGFKYVYLAAFFAFLAGLFHPLITNSGFENLFSGIFVLFVGLAGGVLLYISATYESKRVVFLGVGFALMGISTFYIFQFTGRV